MGTQDVQVFILSTEMSASNPLVIACYPASRPVANDTHGTDKSVLILPQEAIQNPKLGIDPTTFPCQPTLVDNWQQYVGTVSVAAEAARRVGETFTVSEQILSLHQTTEDTLKYGADLSKWPLDARQRKASDDEKWKYVNEVHERARAHAATRPFDLSSDKAWPTKPVKPN